MIPNDKIVVVTGDPRSGTSLMMQTLLALGVPVAGKQFPMRTWSDKQLDNLSEEDRAKRIAQQEKQMADAQDKNPGGFYEVPGVVMRGLKEIGEHGGKAIKIISPGAYPHHGRGTPTEIVHRYILCLRDPCAVAVSQSQLTSGVQVPGPVGWDNASWKIDPTRYMAENGGLANHIAEQDDNSRWLVIDYDSFLDSADATIASIISHLGIEPTDEQITAAVDNVDPNLRRSPEGFDGWGEKQLVGEVAEELYEALGTLDVEAIETVKIKVDEKMALAQLESNRWYMREFGLIANARLYRQISNNAAMRDSLLRDYKKDLHRCLHPQVDQSFDENSPDSEDYTIDRPADLGPITRKLVSYHGELMTWEAAYTLAQRNYGDTKNKRDSDKLASELQRIGG